MTAYARSRETLTETSLRGGAVHLRLDLTYSALLSDDLSEILDRSVGSVILKHVDATEERTTELELDRDQVEWLRSQLDGVLAAMAAGADESEGAPA